MEDLIFKEHIIDKLPLGLYQGTKLTFSRINYFFGANGSGKTLTLRNIITAAKRVIAGSENGNQGYFAQYIQATPNNPDFHRGQFQFVDNAGQKESGDLLPENFYQHLSDHPEIVIRIRDSIQKYLGRHPQISKRGVQNVMTFLREDDADIASYAPTQESDGLKRLSLLLTYIYHPKCLILAIDEPELHLHPDMVSFLLEEIKEEAKYGKQFFFATHSPEVMEIASHDSHAYFYFNLKEKLRDSMVMDLFQVGAQSIMEKLGFQLDVNRRAFLFAPTTLFVEGIVDEMVFSTLKAKKQVEWPRRIFMANIGGAANARNFIELWKKMDKSFCLILDNINGSKNDTVMTAIDDLCSLFSITELDIEEKKKRLKEHNIFIAPYGDILEVSKDGKVIKVATDELQNSWDMFDFSSQIDILKLAFSVEKEVRVQIRDIESDWLKHLIAEIAEQLVNVSDVNLALGETKKYLEEKYPRLQITLNPDTANYLHGVYKVSNHRKLSLFYAKDSISHVIRAEKA